jgi:hypothetical protein
MGKHTPNSATMRRCTDCNGEGRVDAVKSAIRGNGTKVVIGIMKVACPTCDGAGRVMEHGDKARYYMRHNFTDGSIAAMPSHDTWWQVIAGANGSAPNPKKPCSALDFASQQNHLRKQRRDEVAQKYLIPKCSLDLDLMEAMKS